MGRAKVQLHLLKGDEITAESILALLTAITGREPTPEEVAEVRRAMEEYEDGRRPSKDR